MLAKFIALVCLFGLTTAGNLYGFGLGHAGYGGYGGYSRYGGYSGGYSGYASPLITKAYVSPTLSYAAPAVSHVSQYNVHSYPIVKSYATPVITSSYGYAPYAGYGGYGYGGYGAYGSKHGW